VDNNRTSSNQGKKKALIIAISEYDNLPKEKQLPFCKKDGEAVYQLLRDQGYEILDHWKLLGSVNSNQLQKAIFDFFRKQANSKDTLLFYFSGHGIPDGQGGHYLASTDIDPDYPEDPDHRGYAFSNLEDMAKISLAKKIITILDCCFSGAAGITMGTEEDIAKTARSAMDRTFKEGDGKCVLASSLADQVSYKKRGEEYSSFTYYLLEGLKGGNGEAVNLEGYVTPYTLGNYVYNGITSEDRRQKPITKTEMSGDIILAYYPELAERQEKKLVRTNGSLASSSSSSSKINDELRPLLDSARKYYVRGDYEKADIFFERVLEIDPNHIEALNSKGISLYRLEEYDKARDCFKKVLAIDPENIFALNSVETLSKKKDDSIRKAPSEEAPPKVLYTTPFDGVSNVPIDSLISATFSKAMRRETINSITYTVRKDGGSYLAGKISLSADAKTAEFNPDADLAPDTRYIAEISERVTDLAGNTVGSIGSITRWSFTTAGSHATPTRPPHRF